MSENGHWVDITDLIIDKNEVHMCDKCNHPKDKSGTCTTRFNHVQVLHLGGMDFCSGFSPKEDGR